jgi:hypothetical protein
LIEHPSEGVTSTLTVVYFFLLLVISHSFLTSSVVRSTPLWVSEHFISPRHILKNLPSFLISLVFIGMVFHGHFSVSSLDFGSVGIALDS